jgi:hypothetical protein
MINLGNDFNAAVLAAAGVTDADHDSSTVSIGALPDSGDVTVRVTRILAVPAETVRELVAQYAGPTPQSS